MTTDPPTVLIVDDDPDVADAYASWLGDDFTVRVAYNGEEALEDLDDGVDVVLLDRNMPDVSGDDVLDHIRAEGLTCRVAMVTGVDPGFDIIEMGFDDYLQKPVSRDELRDAVEALLARTAYDEGLREYFSLVTKRAVLESERSDEDLAESDEFAGLVERIDRLEAELGETVEELSAEDTLETALSPRHR